MSLVCRFSHIVIVSRLFMLFVFSLSLYIWDYNPKIYKLLCSVSVKRFNIYDEHKESVVFQQELYAFMTLTQNFLFTLNSF